MFHFTGERVVVRKNDRRERLGARAFAVDVKRCAYAEFYKALGEPELGFLMICTADVATAEGFGPDIRLTRTQTIMQGADHCDFRYRRVADGSKGRESE